MISPLPAPRLLAQKAIDELQYRHQYRSPSRHERKESQSADTHAYTLPVFTVEKKRSRQRHCCSSSLATNSLIDATFEHASKPLPYEHKPSHNHNQKPIGKLDTRGNLP